MIFRNAIKQNDVREKILREKGMREMKHMKKLYAVLLTIIMIMGMATTVFAEGSTYSIIINNTDQKTSHTYEIYQIFTGTPSEGKLIDIAWGTGISAAGKTAYGDATDKAATLTESNAKAFAEDIVKNYLGTKLEKTATESSGKYTFSGLSAGYYLIKDANNTQEDPNGSYTSFMLKLTDNVEVTAKDGVPTVTKKVKDKNDSINTENTTGWQDSADYDIGDDVPFQLTATLPGNVTSYDTYKVIFHDTLSAGLTYNNDAVVKVDNSDVTGKFTISYDNNKLTITCNDVTAEDVGAGNGAVITVDYTAKLNTSAVTGANGNDNKVKLEYSNDPNKDGAGDTGNTGETPEDTTIVFTYKVVIDKVDQNKAPLTGAEFTLSKKQSDGTWKTIEVTKNTAGTMFTFSGLDDGDYKLSEVPPKGYNSIDDIYFTVTATHEVTSDNPKLTDLNGNVTTGKITFTKDLSAGSLSSTVENKSGATLPETGGIGTTIFYLLGGLLMIVAVVLLVTKRRMSSEK